LNPVASQPDTGHGCVESDLALIASLVTQPLGEAASDHVQFFWTLVYFTGKRPGRIFFKNFFRIFFGKRTFRK
jgi:hypothetical protein